MGQNKKTVCFSIPCYNEKDNVVPIAEGILHLFEHELQQYDCIVQFIDNNSTDGTRGLLKGLCAKYPNVRAILNARNFPMTSGYWGIINTSGDCTIAIPCDFQVPLEFIPEMLNKWENGAKIVCLTKQSSPESRLMWTARKLFYKITNQLSSVDVLKGFSGCGLYDKSFVDVCRKIDDPVVNFQQIVLSLGFDMETLPYDEVRRKTGKSKNNFWSLLDIAINRFISTSTSGPRIATISGFILAIISFLVGVFYLVRKILFWNNYTAGMTPVLLGVFFIGAMQLFFVGLIGEYIMKINIRLMHRPLVVEAERINFPNKEIECAAKEAE